MTDVIRCPKHNVRCHLVTDGLGRDVAICEKCERRARGRCIDCGGRPRTPHAHRCVQCQRREKNRRQNRRLARYCRWCGGPVRPGSKRQYCSDRCARLRKNKAAVDRWHADAKWREHRTKAKALWRRTPSGVRSYLKSKRKERLSGTWGYTTREKYLAAMRAQNARRDRSQERREWAHTHQTRYAGTGSHPTCATCGGIVPWDGIGRPRKYCPTCHPWRKQ